MTEYSPAEIFSPGEHLKEELEARGWTQTDLAAILGRPIRLVNEIIMGKRGISPETATGLAKALGTSAEVWLGLDAAYQLSKIATPDDVVERRARLYSMAPIKEMIRRHWIEESKSIDVLERQVLDFFGKTSIDEEAATLAHAAKKSTSYETVTPAQEAWMARAYQLAPAVSAKPYSHGAVDGLVAELHRLMRAPEEARLVPRFLAEAGIRFLVVEPLPSTLIDGVSFWLDASSPVIAMSLRYDRIDNFWFVLLHELGHTDQEDALNDIPALDIELESGGDKPPTEEAANDFAGRNLIPDAELRDFIVRTSPLYSTYKVRGFANRIQIHPGIVVGRLQHLGEIEWSHHRRMLTPIRQEVTQVALTDGWGHITPSGI